MAVSKTTKVFLIVAAVTVALVLVSVIAIAIAIGSAGNVHIRDKSVLILRLSGPIPDHRPENPLMDVFGVKEPLSFSEVVTQLRKAKVDDRIGGVVLDLNFPDIGWGKSEELRESIKDFRTSGKPIYAFMEMGMNREYYIATAAEKIFVPPAGDLFINGLSANAMFYRGTLDKLGVEPEVIQIGKYKNAPDQYTRKDMSEGQREVVNAILDEHFSRIVESISETRGKTQDEAKAIIDAAPYNAADAKQQGLIDGALYRDQVYAEMKAKIGYGEGEEIRKVTGVDYRTARVEKLNPSRNDKVAVIYAAGTINTGSSSQDVFGGENVGSDTIVKAVNAAASDESIKAIVLRVDSPGGSALASDMMWHAIENAKAKKPVVVSMSDVAASGGYYIACNANKIVAQNATITGSIGVFLGKPVIKGMYDWMGISNEYVLRGKNAGVFRETEKWTPEERAKMQGMADKIYYDAFIPKVAKGRNLSVEQADRLGQGRVWTGAQAKANGLVDEIGGLEKAISIAKELAGIPADKEVKRVPFPETRDIFESILGADDSAQTDSKDAATRAVIEAMPEDMRKAFYFANLFERMRSGEAMLIMPFGIEIK